MGEKPVERRSRPARGRNRLARRLLRLLWLPCALACATPQSDRVLALPRPHPPRAEVAGVPFFPQREQQCGPAALGMVLAWGGVEVAPEALAPEVLTESRGGSLQSAILGAARRHGRVAYPLHDLEELLAELAAGHPVLVLQNLALRWYPVWHYAVAVGYDLERRRVFLRSGGEARRVVRIETFEHTWARSGSWALSVLPPHELPAAADERRYLLAVTGLERTRRWREAERAYARALERWPESLPAWIGLGGSRHAQGDLAGAEVAFRRAVALDRQEASAHNDLAHVLAEQGRREEASRAIERALEIGGPLDSVYRETRRTIEARQEPDPG